MPIDYPAGQTWPPPAEREAASYYSTWNAWYTGDPERLTAVYNEASPNVQRPRPSQLAGGVVGTFARFWWGRTAMGGTTYKYHVPAAADVCALSARLVYADPPKFNVVNEKDTASQQRLDKILDESQVDTVLHEAAEQAGGMGGVYLRASMNTELAAAPIVEAILPDMAVPEWYGPNLTAVTFWRVLNEDTASQRRIRHLERHEMIRGSCYVFHAVYDGTVDKLGRLMNMAEAPDATVRALAEKVDATGAVEIGTKLLDVVYYPNMKPHGLIRGTQLGRADFAGAEFAMDGLDQAMTSLFRDLRLGGARVFVPREYLRRAGAPGQQGQGAAWDPEQEIFQAINMPVNADGKAELTPQQFSIRVDEHLRIAGEQWRIIMERAGLDKREGDTEMAPETATASNLKASGRRQTRALKIRYQDPQLRKLAQVLLELDVMGYGVSGVTAQPVDLEWPDAAAPDMETMARTIQLLDAAGAVSTMTKVRMLHPEWEGAEVNTEVARIEVSAAPPPEPDAAVDDGIGDNGPPAEPEMLEQ